MINSEDFSLEWQLDNFFSVEAFNDFVNRLWEGLAYKINLSKARVSIIGDNVVFQEVPAARNSFQN